MNEEHTIPKKCEECGKRKPTVLTLERGLTRNFNAALFTKFICDKCKEKKD